MTFNICYGGAKYPYFILYRLLCPNWSGHHSVIPNQFKSNYLICRFSSNGPICSHANPFGPHLDLEYTDSGKGLFWMGLNGLGGTLSKLIISIRPQEYETLSKITI